MNLVCFLASAAAILTAFTVSGATESKVLVHIPFQLHDPNGFDHVMADFGVNPFVSTGRSIAEYVYFVQDGLCRPLTNLTVGHPTHEKPMTPPFILMADDGLCSPVMKARHAQQIGAAALIIADTHCRCSDMECINASKDADCENVDEALMVNDGSGGDVFIPTFKIFKVLADKLRARLVSEDKPALIELQWGIENDEVESKIPHTYFWTTAYDPLVSLEFYVDMNTVFQAFKNDIASVPRFSIIDGQRFQCNHEPDANAPCDHLCTNKGRYCSRHDKNLSGYAIIRETLRRLCIWKEGQAEWYWPYVLYHKQLCATPELFGDQDCLADAFKEAGIDDTVIDSCMEDSGGLDTDEVNSLLDKELQLLNTSGVVSLPAISVDRTVLRWTSAHALYETLCTQYWLSGVKDVPKVCTQCASCPNVVGCLEKGKCVEFENDQRHPDTGYHRSKTGGGKHGSGFLSKFFWFLVVCGILGGSWYYYDQNRERFSFMGNRGGGGGGSLNDYMHLAGED